MLPFRLLLAVFLTLSSVGSVVAAPASSAAGTPYGQEYYTLRSSLENCRLRFERERKGRVAFLGGSITAMHGWRERVGEELQKRFPQTAFQFINAGIPSLGSTPNAFRLSRDVLTSGVIDLLFVEAAVNDSTNGQTDAEQIRGMEGIIRHARQVNPLMDIIQLHFVDPEKMAEIRLGRSPAVIVNHERVASHYAVPSIDLAREVTERIDAGEFSWDKDFKNLHPSPFGHEVYTRSILRFVDAAWAKPSSGMESLRPHSVPIRSIDHASYAAGRLVEPASAERSGGWSLIPEWKPDDGAATRPGFVNVPVAVSTVPGATLRFRFSGTAVGVFVASGPDAGIIEYRVDGGPMATRDLYTQWSAKLHLPWAQVLASGLKPGAHELELRVAAHANEKSRGHAVRIVHFLVNASEPSLALVRE